MKVKVNLTTGQTVVCDIQKSDLEILGEKFKNKNLTGCTTELFFESNPFPVGSVIQCYDYIFLDVKQIVSIFSEG